MAVHLVRLHGLTATALGIGCIIAPLSLHGALAADLPSKGEFRVTFTATVPAPTKPISIGENRMVLVNTAIMTAVNQGGSGLLHNMPGRCMSMTTLDAGAKTFEQHGFCDYVDAENDHVFEQFDFPVQQQVAATRGHGEWIGGTGKFAGVGGKFEIQTTRLNSPTEGATQVIGQKIGSYAVEKASASK